MVNMRLSIYQYFYLKKRNNTYFIPIVAVKVVEKTLVDKMNK